MSANVIEISFLLAELARWREEGLLGEATYRRLVGRYARWVPAVLIPRPQELEQELQQQAQQLLAQDPPPEPDLEQQLEAEVAFQLDLEQQVKAAARSEQARLADVVQVPPAQRADQPAAALSAVADVVGGPLAAPQPRPTPQQQVLQRDSFWSSRLLPFLHDNALWLAGGLLVIVGSLYFLGLVWDSLSSLLLHSVITVALLGYGGAFFGVGYALSRRANGGAVARILYCFAAAILPLSSVATGELAALLLHQHGLAGGVAAAVTAAAVLAAQGFMLAVMGGLYERSAIRPLVWAALGLSGLTMMVAPAGELGAGGAAPLATVAGVVLLRQGLLALCRGRVHLRMSLLFVGGNLLWAVAVLAGRVQVAAPVAPTHWAPLLAAVAGLLLACDHRLRREAGQPPRLTPLGLTLHAGLLAAVALSVMGLARLGYFDVWARVTVLATSALALISLAQGAVRHGRGALTQLAAGAGLLTYFFLPAPFSGLLLLAQRWVSAALGYQREPLPVAYYGLTFIPYLLGLTVLATLLRQRRPDLARDLQRFLLVLSGGLVLAALASRGDLRPMLWTWPLYAAGAVAWSQLFARPWLRHAGHLLVLAFLWVLGLWLWQQGWGVAPGVLLGAWSAALAASAALWHRARHATWPALAAAGLGLASLALAPVDLSTACFTAGSTGLTLILVAQGRRSRFAALGAAVLVFAATLLCCINWTSQASHVVLIFAALGGACCALAHACCARGPAVWRLVVQPAMLCALAALGMVLLIGVNEPALPRVASLLAGMMALHLALITRGRVATLACAAALAVAWSALAAQLSADHWPPLLGLLAPLMLLASARLKRLRWPAARARAQMLTVAASLVTLVAVAGTLGLAADAAGHHPPWIALALGLASLYLITCTWLARRSTWVGPITLGALALSTTGGAAALLAHWCGASAGADWQQGALCAALALAWTLAGVRLRQPGLQRVALWAGGLLVTLALALAAGPVALAGLRCGAPGWLTSGISSAAVVGPLLALATLLAAAWYHRATCGGALAANLWVACGVVSLLVLHRLALPGLHLTVPLALCAVALAWLMGRRGAARVSLRWPLGLAALGLLASHGHPGLPQLWLALASVSAVLALAWRVATRAGKDTAPLLELGWSAGLLITGQLAVVWLARLLSTGRHPAAAALALMAVMALATGLALEALHHVVQRRQGGARARGLPWSSWLGRAAPLLAAALALGAVVGCQPEPPGFVLVLCCLTLVGAAAQWSRGGWVDQRRWPLYTAGAALTLLYLVLRTQTALAELGPPLRGAMILLGAHAALWSAASLAQGRARRALRGPLVALATLWPLGVVASCLELTPAGASLLCLLVAAHYCVMQRVLSGGRGHTLLALGFGNAALALTYSALGWSDGLLYALPLATTMLWLVHTYRPELGEPASRVLRVMVLMALYTFSTGHALVELTPLHSLVVVPALCVAGIILGTILRVRIYVWIGGGYLAADLLLNMLRYGLSNPHLGALFLTLLGLALVASMVVFTLERERIINRYSAIFSELRTWD